MAPIIITKIVCALAGARVLDVGSGSGYLSAVMGLLVEPSGGRVTGVEQVPALAARSLQSIQVTHSLQLIAADPSTFLRAVSEMHPNSSQQSYAKHLLKESLQMYVYLSNGLSTNASVKFLLPT